VSPVLSPSAEAPGNGAAAEAGRVWRWLARAAVAAMFVGAGAFAQWAHDRIEEHGRTLERLEERSEQMSKTLDRVLDKLNKL
jgi:hypothetical protein